MYKYIVTIEEMISQDFEVDANSLEEALKLGKEKYNNCEFILTPGNLVYRQISADDKKGDCCEWYEF